MEIDLASVDHVLATTRSVRKRLDLSRPVSDELILECVDLAEQAPTGGNISSRRWMVVKDPPSKALLADLYRAAGGDRIAALADRLRGTDHPSEKVMDSGAYLARHLQDVPAIVIVCIWGHHDASGRPGLFDSVLQAAWSFCLAARARGLGTAWTTLHLGKAGAIADLLGIPAGVTQVVLLPVAHTEGDFHRATRRPADEITYFNRWGCTRDGVTVEIDIDATPARVRALLGDEPDEPGEPRRFELEPIGRTVRLRLHVTLGAESAEPILAERLAQLRASMQATVEEIKARAEQPVVDPPPRT